ncbi:MAG TPA: DNA helicase RecQ [Bacteroidales bacterium]|mgnify:FL=1|nr:DNA helicase RecQ [Bacteroidales bacterium]HPI30364.1 DNA helicase RecQ [Bacteroidales bacterium]HQN15970.1 DNA helicase RecQ [Bacteroidales bacterium]HQP15589.1 DNA helicase RecQ [Bacteroidales bacterium]
MKEKSGDKLHIVLKEFFGFDTFKGNQEAVIKNVLDGKDTFVIMPTGGGKSLTYQLPALISDGTAIIISPLISLMKNQVDNIRNFGVDKGIANFLNSSLSKQEMTDVKADLLAGKTKLLYVAPETLTKKENIEFFKQFKISFYAIDEAHCISEWGHDFRPEYRNIRPTIKAIGKKVPVMALTATATPKVQHDIQKNLGMMNAGLFKSSFNRPNLYYEVRAKTKDVQRDIIKYIKSNSGKSGIIYCLSRKKVEELAETLQVNGIKALPYHAGLESEVRKANQDKFLMEEVDVIVATIAFGMGIDKPDVRYVIHHDMPKSLEGYYQETGRSGRDDGEGNCIAFYAYEDIQKLEKFTSKKSVNEQEIAKQLLMETIAYAESSVCRRKLLLHYFGEVFEEENCQCCDNCLHPKTKFDGTAYVETVLEAVVETKEQCKGAHLVNVLIGKVSAQVKSFKHHKLNVFGKGADHDEKFWTAVIRQTIVNGLLSKDIENYGILKITKEGEKFLDEPETIMLTQDHDYDTPEEDEFFAGGGKTSTADKTLFTLLKDLRKQISRKENLPPFVIFQDPSLEDMAIQYPIKMDELMQITGVGSGKAQKYGKPFLDLIAKYVEENEIIRPMDMIVKSVVNKSGLKVYIIQNIDRKIPLEDIANAKNLTIEELLMELESIVASGTKLDINYYIEEYVEPYHQEEIYDYFYEAETDSVEDALKELGEEEFSEEEIRLVRLKFLSEVGN